MNIEEHLPFVKGLAKKMARKYGRGEDLQDLVQVGSMGLMEALENYTPQEGVKLRSYLYNRVNGSLIDHFRGLDWASRNHRREQKEIKAAKRSLQQTLCRKPTETETAKRLNLELREYQRRVAEGYASDVQNYDSNSDFNIIFQLTPADVHHEPMNALQQKQSITSLVSAMERLPERSRKIMNHLYVDEMTLQETGDRLGLTESRIGQIHRTTVASLREQLNKDKSC